MKLVIATPMEIVVEAPEVRYVRAEDATGAFGILPGHADFITTLEVSVISWRNGQDEEHHAAVQGGTLVVRDGSLVEVATRQAVREDALGELGPAILQRLREERLSEESSRSSANRLHLAVVRELMRYVRPAQQGMPQGAPPTVGAAASGQVPRDGGQGR
ncbi:MAG: F0F1 ATP synthase subunit epsilon [Limibacillus sp.]|jgi:F-type H+-transporting ATPase subunit epsilon